MNELKNLTANGMTTIGPALKNAFDYLNINRLQTGIDTHGSGRCPYYLEAAIIIAITDGTRYTSTTNVQPELNLPMVNHTPGAELTLEPFRWDQRLFSIVLRLGGTYNIDQQSNGANISVPYDESPINAMCDVTGGKIVYCFYVSMFKIFIFLGRSFCVTSMKTLNSSIEQLVSRMHIGVMIKFEKFGPEPPVIIPNEEETIIDINNRSWTSVRNLIYVRSGQKGYSVGHWPIPEAYWPDNGVPNLPPRTAHPIVKFTCTNSEPTVIDNLPFDKYELDPSPLTQFILSRKQPNVAWQVYVANSQRGSELGQPFGYLKASTSLTCVNLFVLPYNYPVLLPLLDELLKVLNGKPSREWKMQFDNYLKLMPAYYAAPLRRALQRMGANSAIVPESFDVYSSVTLNNLIKKNKNLAKIEFEKLAAAVGSQKPTSAEWPRISSNHLFPYNRKSALEYCSNPSLKKLFSSIQSEQLPDFSSFVVTFKDKPNRESKGHCYRNPFDISRHDLIDQVHKLRRNFFQKQTSLVKFQDEDQMHSLPVSQMGNYQEYLKKLPVPLREIEATPTRQHMFGNPFKLDKKNMMMIDEADIDLVGNGSPGKSSQSGKRPVSDPYKIASNNREKRKPGPLPKDFPYNRPLTPPPSPVPSPTFSPSSSPSHTSFSLPPQYTTPQSPSQHFYQYHNNGQFPGKSSVNGHLLKTPKNVNIQGSSANSSSDIVLVSTTKTNNTNYQSEISSRSLGRASSHVNTNNNNKRPLTMTNGVANINKLFKTSQAPTVLPEQNGTPELSEYLLNFYRRKNFTMEEYEKKTQAISLVRRSSKGNIF